VKALCKYCDKPLNAKRNHETSHLWSHYDSCPKNDQTVRSTPSQRSRVREDAFNQEVSRRKLVEAIIMHEYPLTIVEYIGFKMFSFSLETRFKMVSRGTIKRDILKKI